MPDQIDFGKTAQDYVQYRAGFPPALFDRLSRRGIGLAGQRVVDLGTGTGTMARNFALRGCQVTALDIAGSLLLEGQSLDEADRVTVKRLVSRAEIIGLCAASFDVVAAGQCWHWFNRPQAAAEVRRLLSSGAHLVIAHFDWLPLPGNMVEATEQLILRHNPSWHLSGGTGFYPAWAADVAMAGFKDIETFTFDLDVPYSHVAWRGRIRASAGVAASLPPAQVEQFDQDLAALLHQQFPDNPLQVPHRVFALLAKTF